MITPYDIYRKFETDLRYLPPEDNDLWLFKTKTVIERIEKIYDAGPRTDGGEEALQVLADLRRLEAVLRMR